MLVEHALDAPAPDQESPGMLAAGQIEHAAPVCLRLGEVEEVHEQRVLADRVLALPVDEFELGDLSVCL